MLLDASTGGTIRTLTKEQVKELVEKVFLKEYRSKNERGVKVETTDTPYGVLTLDMHTALLPHIELLNKILAERNLNQANVS